MYEKDKKPLNGPYIFSILGEKMDSILINHPEFKKLLKIRAIRR